MTNAWMSRGLWLAVSGAVSFAIAAGCGGGDVGGGSMSATGSGAGNTTSTGAAMGGSTGTFVGSGSSQLQSISVDPPMGAITSLNGSPVTKQFVATGHYTDGSSHPITDASWSSDNLSMGAIDNTGLYTANGTLGGLVHVQAQSGMQKASATLQVTLDLQQNPANAPPATVTALEGATTPDPGVVWAYPYDQTVWPRGLLAPILQWNGGAPTDVILVHLKNSTFELEQISNAPAGSPTAQLPIDQATWDMFVNSSSGATTMTVARWDGANATLLANHTWTIAPGSMTGTIYYWSNDLGRVLRIQPGAPMPDDFANIAPLNDPASYDQSAGCLMTCHTVSADGSTLISGGGIYGGSYDLKNLQPIHFNGGTWGSASNKDMQPQWMSVQWYAAAPSPNGKYVLANSMGAAIVSQAGGPAPAAFMDLFTTADGQPVATSGVAGQPFGQPAWSPEGSLIAYVDPGDPGAWGVGWNAPPPGDLKVISFDESANPMLSNPQTMIATGANPSKRIAWPTVTPDGKWVLYSRTQDADTRDGPGDLYIASTTVPNMEIRLSSLDGDTYPFAAGARDLSWNFEPSFAPVASGGYFWVVFTSRRTYGNTLVGDKTQVKQLWVAAIDTNPQPGVNPSHPAFHLTGQAQNLAMRGFWALNPCKADKQGCTSGTDCCGGFCDPNGLCSSTSGGCSQDGDKCDTDADCCGQATGTTCINHVCSVSGPK